MEEAVEGQELELDAVVDADGEELPEEALEELAALAEAAVAEEESREAERAAELSRLQRELDAQRTQAGAALARYRAAVLAAEPELPPELVRGETLEELETSLGSARRAVAQIRERLAVEGESERGFPVGAPARAVRSATGMSAAEKIALGLEQRAQSS